MWMKGDEVWVWRFLLSRDFADRSSWPAAFTRSKWILGERGCAEISWKSRLVFVAVFTFLGVWSDGDADAVLTQSSVL